MRMILRDARGKERSHSQDASESGIETKNLSLNSTKAQTI